jgi:hypothetical protein
MDVAQVHDSASVVEACRDQTLSAQHVLGTESFVEHVQVPHAVEERDDGGAGADGRSQRAHGCIQVVRLATENHDVERLAHFGRQNCGRRRQVGVAKAALDHQAGFSKLGGSLWPDEKRDITASLKQASAEVPTNRTGTDDQNPHESALVGAMPESRAVVSGKATLATGTCPLCPALLSTKVASTCPRNLRGQAVWPE